MKKTQHLTIITSAALMIAILASLGIFFAAASAQTGAPTGPTPGNCYSAQFPAASGCDLVSFGAVPATGGSSVVAAESISIAPTNKDCYSTRFHAASDCDRLNSGE